MQIIIKDEFNIDNNIYFTDKSKRPVLIKELKKFIETQNKANKEIGIGIIPINSTKKELIKNLNNATCFLKDFKAFDTLKKAIKYRDSK